MPEGTSSRFFMRQYTVLKTIIAKQLSEAEESGDNEGQQSPDDDG